MKLTETYNLKDRRAGEDRTLGLRFKGKDVTDWDMYATFTDNKGNVVLSLSTVDSTIDNGGTDGTFTLIFSAEDTAKLPERLTYEIVVVIDSKRTCVLEGTARFKRMYTEVS